uniref:Ras-like protein (Trinotate prediction) n=1 Tax=Myxobolus squamalis TaxID=59785 RepID=A0A6B2FZM6_MYXSQ
MRLSLFVRQNSGGVGKTALVTQFIQNQFSDEYDPTIEDTFRKQIMIDGKPALLDIMDTAGQEEFSSLQDGYIRQGNMYVLVFALDSPQSLMDLKGYVDNVKL